MGCRRGVGYLALGLLALVGCAAGRPRLPPRIIDDPMTVPPGMFWLGGSAQVNSMVQPAMGRSWNHSEGSEFRLGLTKRVELVDLLALRLAVLDDSPARADPDALTLAIKAGLGNLEFGDDFHPNAGLIPVLRLDAARRVSPRWRLATHAGQRTYRYDHHAFDEYAPTVSSAGVEALYQLTEEVAVRGGLQGYRWTITPRLWRPTAQGGWGPNVWVGVRPRRWITLGATASLVLAWVNQTPPAANPERSVAEARALFVEPHYRIAIVGAQVSLHN